MAEMKENALEAAKSICGMIKGQKKNKKGHHIVMWCPFLYLFDLRSYY